MKEHDLATLVEYRCSHCKKDFKVLRKHLPEDKMHTHKFRCIGCDEEFLILDLMATGDFKWMSIE